MNDPRVRLSKECVEALALLGIDDAKGVNWFIMGCLTTGFSEKEVIGIPSLPPQEPRTSKPTPRLERKEPPTWGKRDLIDTRMLKYISINWKRTPEYYRCQRIFENAKIVDWEIYAWPLLGMIPTEEYYTSSWIKEWVELFTLY